MMWYLISLVLVVSVAGIFWRYKNIIAKRDAEREQKFGQMLEELKRGSTPHSALAANAAIAVSAPTSIQFSKKTRLFAPDSALIYYVFRAGLPDHEIFANQLLGDLVVVSTPGYEAEQKMKRLAVARADFVVCNKRMEIVAVVLIADSAAAAETSLIEECLQSTGIRLVRIDPTAVPKHTQVRALIYGRA
jgi:hypothetical protein